ncbi:MAG: tripartite tricarboxylate transporter substrate binding protein [Polaromonas sp.]
MKTLFAAALTLLLSASAVAADPYPNKMIRMVVPYSAGGTGDQIGRLMGDKLGELLGQRFIIDNKPGAGGNIGAEATVRSPADGYTVVMAATSLASNPSLQKKMSFDPQKDLVPISQCCGVPMVVVVHPSLPIRSVAELVAYAKAKPGKLTFASSGIGTSSHLAAELFKQQAGVELIHVPYKADSQALPDLLGGNVDLMFMFQTSALPQVKAGKLRALAVSTAKRSPAAPDLPTVVEAGVPGYEFNGWFGLFAPAGTPKPVLDTLAAAAVRAVQSPELKAKLIELGFVPVGDTPAAFDSFFRAELAKWARVARDGKLQLID